MLFDPFKKRRTRGKPEKEIQKAIVAWLHYHRVLLAVTDAGLLHGIPTGVPTGWPDITGVLPGGRFLGVEVKAPKGRVSEAQLDMQKRIEALGGLCIHAHSLEELIEAFRAEEKLGNIIGISLD